MKNCILHFHTNNTKCWSGSIKELLLVLLNSDLGLIVKCTQGSLTEISEFQSWKLNRCKLSRRAHHLLRVDRRQIDATCCIVFTILVFVQHKTVYLVKIALSLRGVRHRSVFYIQNVANDRPVSISTTKSGWRYRESSGTVGLSAAATENSCSACLFALQLFPMTVGRWPFIVAISN